MVEDPALLGSSRGWAMWRWYRRTGSNVAAVVEVEPDPAFDGLSAEDRAAHIVERIRAGAPLAIQPTIRDAFALLGTPGLSLGEWFPPTGPATTMSDDDAESMRRAVELAETVLVESGAREPEVARSTAEQVLLAEARRLRSRAREAPAEEAAALDEAAVALFGRALSLPRERDAVARHAVADEPAGNVADEPAGNEEA